MIGHIVQRANGLSSRFQVISLTDFIDHDHWLAHAMRPSWPVKRPLKQNSTVSSITAVLSKLYPVRSHTGAAQGGISAALGNREEDKPEWHAFDTVKGGDYLVDQKAAMIMAEDAVQAVYDLENRGLPFSRTKEGKIDQRRFGGHTKNFGQGPVRRACYASDRTGHMILHSLYGNILKNETKTYDEWFQRGHRNGVIK